MGKAYLFYNPLASHTQEDLEALQVVLEGEAVLCDMTRPETYETQLFAMGQEDYLVLCGGDGTLHRFVNLTSGIPIRSPILYYPAGEHNDFARDLRRHNGGLPFCINPYLQDLPRLTVGDRENLFLTGVQFGFIPEKREKGRGLRQIFRAGKGYDGVTVTVDGAKHRFEKVSMGAVMLRRFCAGGIEPVPGMERDGKKLQLMLLPDCTPRQARELRRRLRKGKTPDRRCQVLSGREITLSFDRPVELYADGERLPRRSRITCYRE